jgi:hypothetical protein
LEPPSRYSDLFPDAKLMKISMQNNSFPPNFWGKYYFFLQRTSRTFFIAMVQLSPVRPDGEKTLYNDERDNAVPTPGG